MKAVATTFTLLAIVVAVLLESVPSHAWRPQGRFGKRRTVEEDSSGPEPASSHATQEHPAPRRVSGALPSGFPEDLELPVFQYGKIICIHKGAKGIYRCVRWQDSEAAEKMQD